MVCRGIFGCSKVAGMPLVLAWGFSAALAAPVVGAPATATVVQVVSPPPAVMTAAELLKAGRLLEAALEYEEAWRAHGRAEDLLGASQAREAMGHRGHAVSYLRELAARGDGDAAVQTRLAALAPSLVEVRVVVTTPEVERDLVVRARYRGRAADARPDLLVRTPSGRRRSAEVIVALDPGDWELWIDDEYFTESRASVAVVAGNVAPAVSLAPRPRDPPSVHARRMVSPGLLLGVGVGLLAGGVVETKRVHRRSDEECFGSGWPCRDLSARGVSLRSAGAGLLGASVGMAAAHLVQLSPKRKVRRTVWATEAGLGLVGVIAGSVGVALSARAFNGLDRGLQWSHAGFQADLKHTGATHTTAAFFLGLGAGMLVRSLGYLAGTSGMLWKARHARGTRRGPFVFAPTGAGGAVTARF